MKSFEIKIAKLQEHNDTKGVIFLNIFFLAKQQQQYNNNRVIVNQ